MNTIILIIILLIKKPINTDYSALTGKIETNPKAPPFKVNDRVRITKKNYNFSKNYTENGSTEIFIKFTKWRKNNTKFS